MTVLDRVRKIVAQALSIPVSTITQDTDLGELGADQQTLNDIKHLIEEEFDIRVSDDEASELTTIEDICELIKSKKPCQ
jgi:acyl carrier protein